MIVPSENTANAIFIAITGFPTTVFAFALSQTEVALIAIAVNVCLAVGMKAVDVGLRLYLKDRK